MCGRIDQLSFVTRINHGSGFSWLRDALDEIEGDMNQVQVHLSLRNYLATGNDIIVHKRNSWSVHTTLLFWGEKNYYKSELEGIRMWRHAVKVATRPTRWMAGTRPCGCSMVSIFPPRKDVAVRYFARRPRDGLDDVDDVLKEQTENEKERTRSKTLSATEMELFAMGEDLGDNDDDNDEEDDARMDAEYQRKQEAIRKELDSRTGRGWTDPWHISEEQWMSLQTADDLPGWSPEFVSRISQERVKIHADGIPTLSALATMSFPPEPCPHPGLGQTKEYAAFRKKFHYNYIAKKVEELAKPNLDKILKLTQWEKKQDAVDELFENVEEQLRNQEEILGLHPDFPKWVERALEKYLIKVKYGNVTNDVVKSETELKDADAEPLFMDCYNPADSDSIVPSILSPLAPHHRDGPGRMVEEWQLAAHKSTKRILMRTSTRKIAETLEKNDASRIFVCGRKGVGKVCKKKKNCDFVCMLALIRAIFSSVDGGSGIHCCFR